MKIADIRENIHLMRFCHALLFLLFLCTSCSKKNSNTTTPDITLADSITISYTGDLVKKSYVYFKTNVMLGNNAVWDFGDGETSDELSPRHMYETEGVYMVSLSVNGEAAKTQTREVAIQNLNTQKILGSRIWVLKRRYAYKDGIKTDPYAITEYEQPLDIEMVYPTTLKITENPYFPEVILKLGISNSGYMNFKDQPETAPSFTSLSYYINESKLTLMTRQRKYAADGVTIIEEMVITSEIKL